MLKFIALSNLMATSPLSGMNLTDLRTQLQTSLGQKTITNCSQAQLPPEMQDSVGKKEPQNWLRLIANCSEQLMDHDVQYVVVDTLQHLERSEVSEVTRLLQKISRKGLCIIAIDHHKTPIFFSTMREIVCTDEFMDIYVKSMWHASQKLKPRTRVSAISPSKAPSTAPKKFQFMSRIFVA